MTTAPRAGLGGHARLGAVVALLLCVAMPDPLTSSRRTTYAPALQGPQGLIASPFQFLVTGEDNLAITTRNSVAGAVVEVDYRFLEDGVLVPQATSLLHVPNTDRTAKTTYHKLGTGALLNLRIIASAGAPAIGQTFVTVRVIRGDGAQGLALGTLVQGYVTGTQDLAWPGSPIQNSLEPGYAVRMIQGTDPAAGAELAEILPFGVRWELLSFVVRLVTDATVGTRFVFLQIELPNPVPPLNFSASNVQPASQTFDYTWAAGLPYGIQLPSAFPQAPLSTPLLLTGGGTIKTRTFGLFAGDNFGAPLYQVREWLEP